MYPLPTPSPGRLILAFSSQWLQRLPRRAYHRIVLTPTPSQPCTTRFPHTAPPNSAQVWSMRTSEPPPTPLRPSHWSSYPLSDQRANNRPWKP
ncbi:hypothetical protein T484DRAFT_1980807 [Baffinella frigidus]|nr:hypothetical protein T484DRAFT_1980807 [Cryptophyta sp. CCMP2293]